jgi:hypothetical protein
VELAVDVGGGLAVSAKAKEGEDEAVPPAAKVPLCVGLTLREGGLLVEGEGVPLALHDDLSETEALEESPPKSELVEAALCEEKDEKEEVGLGEPAEEGVALALWPQPGEPVALAQRVGGCVPDTLPVTLPPSPAVAVLHRVAESAGLGVRVMGAENVLLSKEGFPVGVRVGEGGAVKVPKSFPADAVPQDEAVGAVEGEMPEGVGEAVPPEGEKLGWEEALGQAEEDSEELADPTVPRALVVPPPRLLRVTEGVAVCTGTEIVGVSEAQSVVGVGGSVGGGDRDGLVVGAEDTEGEREPALVREFFGEGDADGLLEGLEEAEGEGGEVREASGLALSLEVALVEEEAERLLEGLREALGLGDFSLLAVA